MTGPDQQLAALDGVLELTVLLGADMERGLAGLGLTPARTRLLWELQARGPSAQRVLAEALDVTPRNVTGLVDGLVSTGFAVREPHPSDRRTTLVTLTDTGREVAAGLVTGRAELAGTLFAGLPPDQFTGFTAVLAELLTRVRAELAAAAEHRA